VQLSASDECDFEKENTLAFLLWYFYTSFYHPLTLPASDSIPSAFLTPLPSSLFYQFPPRQPTNLSFVSLPRQLRLSQVDTQLQNIQFERKVKTKWIFQREYSRYQKPMLSSMTAHRFATSQKMYVTKKYSHFYVYYVFVYCAIKMSLHLFSLSCSCIPNN